MLIFTLQLCNVRIYVYVKLAFFVVKMYSHFPVNATHHSGIRNSSFVSKALIIHDLNQNVNGFPVYTAVIVFLPIKKLLTGINGSKAYIMFRGERKDSFCHQIPGLCIQPNSGCCVVGS